MAIQMAAIQTVAIQTMAIQRPFRPRGEAWARPLPRAAPPAVVTSALIAAAVVASTIVAAAPACAGVSRAADVVDGFVAGAYTDARGETMPYRLFVPRIKSPARKYPLVIYLHGVGERGVDNVGQISIQGSRAATHLWTAPRNQARHPCFVLAPQCPLGSQWVETPWSAGSYSVDRVRTSRPMEAVLGLVASLLGELPIDPQRLYATGASMGGFGAWDLVLRNPRTFAAVVSVCGGGDPSKARLVAHMGVWAMHGADDPVVPVEGAREMVAALKEAGAKPRYTEYPGTGHACWYKAFGEPELVPWLFSHSLGPTAAPAGARKALERARSAVSRGDYARAAAALAKLRGLDLPGDVREEIDRLAEPIEAEVEAEAARRFEEAKRMSEGGQILEALAALESIAREFAWTAAARDARALADEIEEDPRTASLRRESEAAGLLQRGEARLAAADYEAAGRLFEEVLAEFAGTQAAASASARLAELSADGELGRRAASRKAEREMRSWLSMARNWARAGEAKKAAEYYRKILDAYPDSPAAASAREELEGLEGLP